MCSQRIDDSSPIEIIYLDDIPLQDNLLHELIVKENKLFIEVINKFIHTNDGKGMSRVLRRMLIPAYNELDENYSKSPKFEKVLKNTLQQLTINPLHKFSHVRYLYETLKLHKARKKVNFVTLATNLTESSTSTKRILDQTHNLSKRPKVDIIDFNDYNSSVINVDNYEYDVIVLDDGQTNLNKENVNKESYNLSTDQTQPVTSQCDNDINPNAVEDNNAGSKDQRPIEGRDIEITVDESSKFLIPRKQETYEEYRLKNAEKVQVIENEIAKYKEIIAVLEEKEVDDDTIDSPYILCESYKAKVVELYKELCELTGSDSVKRREVRLKVIDGYPPGPLLRLERFLNDNIGSNGDPPFPDFSDVVKCVMVSNIEDGLGWNKTQIMKGATALFTQCGRALQRRRQKREWRHLMSRVKLEHCHADPAEDSPELEAKLQENMRMAMKKETDILDSFTQMQDKPLNQVTANIEKAQENNIIESNNSDSEWGTDSETERNDTNETNNNIDTVERGVTSSSQANSCTDDNGCVKVKKEPVEDVLELLEGLGDNYTITVKDIEDPTLVIEISSDSSTDGSSDEE